MLYFFISFFVVIACCILLIGYIVHGDKKNRHSDNVVEDIVKNILTNQL